MYINPLIENLERKYPSGNRTSILRLDMNENPGGLPETFVENIKQEITSEFLSTYPDKEPLITSLANFHNIEKNCIAVTDGSEMALKYIFEAFSKPGNYFVSVIPTFEMYAVYANMYGLKHKAVKIDSQFQIDIDALLHSIDDETSIVSLLNPNNPIGRPYTDEEFKLIADKTREVGALLIIDEAYHYFYKHTQLPLLEEYNHIVILRTFSKLFSIAACRIGYAISSPTIIKMINNVRPTFDTNSIALLFANHIINNKSLLDKLIEEELEGRLYLIDALKIAGYEPISDGGNYITFKPKINAQVLADKLLKEWNIAIKTSGYDILKDYIRVTTGSIRYMKEFINALLSLDK